MLTSDKEEKYTILATTHNFAVSWCKLQIYTLQTPSEVFWKFVAPEGYNECAVERSSSFIQNMWTKKVQQYLHSIQWL